MSALATSEPMSEDDARRPRDAAMTKTTPRDQVSSRDRARRQAHGDAWADAVAALAASAPRRLTAEQARVVKTGLRLDPTHGKKGAMA
ncbi:hypothetical protein [Janibacter sp. GS2]|uniref:hypothetical protein n=1 Tax=Janibacter sp. GS2 TaxID=3442646 RepID=UPI003EBB1222